MVKIVECVPNFSTSDPEVIKKITDAITKIPGVELLDVQSDASHNRTVVTLAGSPDAISNGAFEGVKKAKDLINLQEHQGEHPRMGATDVVPFIPVKGVKMADCKEIARSLAERIWNELEIPTFLYEKAAKSKDRTNLSKLRKGQFEGLKKMSDDGWPKEKRKPDFGEVIHPTAGSTAVGARPFLIAWNAYLNSNDLKIANEISSAIANRKGGFRSVKSLGFAIEDRAVVQISCNLVDYKDTAIHLALEMIKTLATNYGLTVTDTEIVGLVPNDALIDSSIYYLQLHGFHKSQILENCLAGEARDDTLVEKKLNRYLDELASRSPAPGGGSVAAVSGAQGAALISMVCNITVRKKAYRDVRDEIKSIRTDSEKHRSRLTELIDIDANAFTTVIDAMKLPQKTEEEIAARHKAIQTGYKTAAEVPMETCRISKNALDLTTRLAEIGFKGCISDAGVAALALQTAIHSAIMNVRINLGDIEDKAFCTKWEDELNRIETETNELVPKVMKIAYSRIAGDSR